MPTDKTLVIVAVRCDHSEEVKRRIQTILAATSTYDRPPDTVATVYAKSVSDLVASDFDHLAHFMGENAVRDLNVGDVVTTDG